MRALRATASAALAVALILCAAPLAGANHTLQGLLSPPGSAPYDWDAIHASPDGARVIYNTAEPLDPADTDTQPDLYEGVGGTFSLLSPSTTASVCCETRLFSLDGSQVFFATVDPLVPADRDITKDVYRGSGGEVDLVSVGDLPSNGLYDATLRDVSEDGARVFFTTEEKLVAGDTDGGYIDVYEHSPSGTRLVSTGPTGGSGAFDATFHDASGPGTTVAFSTGEKLVAADTDTLADLYINSAGTTELVTAGPGGGSFGALSRSGDRVVFATLNRLVAEDTDSVGDVYVRAGATTTLVSQGPTGTNGNQDATFESASADATNVLFYTFEHLTADHTWTGAGHYRRSGATTELVIPVQVPAAVRTQSSGDGSHAFYLTNTKVLPQDTDPTTDVYEWDEGVTRLVTTGPQDYQWINEHGVLPSYDGERAFFSSYAKLVPADTDNSPDAYERYQGQTYLLSGSEPTGFMLPAGTPDGSRLVIETQTSLTPDDTDAGRTDAYLYESAPGALSLWEPAGSNVFRGAVP